MSTYTYQDIQTDIYGDIKISDQGDIQLGNSLDTYKSAANFLLRTDFGDYAPDNSVGCNLGSFVGKNNTPNNREYMEQNINSVLKRVLFNSTDVEATVVAFDINEVLCVINIGGAYLIDGTIQTVNGDISTYVFPFIEGSYITPLTI